MLLYLKSICKFNATKIIYLKIIPFKVSCLKISIHSCCIIWNYNEFVDVLCIQKSRISKRGNQHDKKINNKPTRIQITRTQDTPHTHTHTHRYQTHKHIYTHKYTLTYTLNHTQPYKCTVCGAYKNGKQIWIFKLVFVNFCCCRCCCCCCCRCFVVTIASCCCCWQSLEMFNDS